MPFQLTCVSHGPALATPRPEPKQHGEVLRAYADRAAALQAFDPELIIMFAPDHYTNVHLNLVPPFGVGLACEAVADYGGFPGRFDVPAEMAAACIKALREADFDVAVSHQMSVDHGFSQPLHRLAGSLDRYPVIPVFINTTCSPASSFRRVRMLGEAVGRFARAQGKRTCFLASGGLSHHPVNIFPQELAGAPSQVSEYLVHGGARGEMNREGWLDFLGRETAAGGDRVARGERVASDFRINPEWDQRFLRLFAAGDFSVFDDWSAEEVVASAGVAAMEVQQWVAAASAAKVCGVGPIEVDLYVATVEYRLAVGVAHADPLPASS